MELVTFEMDLVYSNVKISLPQTLSTNLIPATQNTCKQHFSLIDQVRLGLDRNASSWLPEIDPMIFIIHMTSDLGVGPYY